MRGKAPNPQRRDHDRGARPAATTPGYGTTTVFFGFRCSVHVLLALWGKGPFKLCEAIVYLVMLGPLRYPAPDGKPC